MIGFFEPDPFPLIDPHLAAILYSIDALLLQRRIISIGSIRRMMAEFDLEREKLFDRCLLNGMLHFLSTGDDTFITDNTSIAALETAMFQDCHPSCSITIEEAKERGLL
jgi:hypothetical protein